MASVEAPQKTFEEGHDDFVAGVEYKTGDVRARTNPQSGVAKRATSQFLKKLYDIMKSWPAKNSNIQFEIYVYQNVFLVLTNLYNFIRHQRC